MYSAIKKIVKRQTNQFLGIVGRSQNNVLIQSVYKYNNNNNEETRKIRLRKKTRTHTYTRISKHILYERERQHQFAESIKVIVYTHRPLSSIHSLKNADSYTITHISCDFHSFY